MNPAICSRCNTPCEPEDIRCPVCAGALPPLNGLKTEAIVQILRCEECGAALRYSAEHRGITCAFCGARLAIETPEDPIEQAEWTLPFDVSAERARQVLVQWLGRQGFFTPSDLQRASVLETLHPLWWAAWLVDARALVSWTADSDAGAARSSWAPHAGQTSLSFENLIVSASRGLNASEAARLSPWFQISRAQRTEAKKNAGVEEFDAQRSSARKIVAAGIETSVAATLQKGVIPGSRFRNVHVSVLLESLMSRRFSLPSYVLAYRYNGKVYRALVHGQNADCVFGSVPYSAAKIFFAVCSGLFLVAVVAYFLLRR